MRDLSQAIELDPNLAAAYENRGAAYLDKGEIDLAMEDLDRAIALDLNSESAFRKRATIYLTKKLSQKSLLLRREKVRMTETVSVTLTSILSHPGRGVQGRCFEIVSKCENDSAIQDLERAIALDPKSASAYCNRGVAYWYKGAHARAVADYDKAIGIGPENSRVLLQSLRELVAGEILGESVRRSFDGP